MNANDDNQKTGDHREDRTAAPKGEPFEPESAPPKEPADFRETSEGGYGWGV